MRGSYRGKNGDSIAHAIELATDSSLGQPDQTAFLEICSQINQNRNGPRVALDVMIDQLEETATSDPKSACLTLMLLDSCVKHCGYRFTRKLCKVDYLKRLKKVVRRKDIAIGVQKRLLGLIQTWALALSDHVDFQSIDELYQGLLDKSVQFPPVEDIEVDLLRLTFQSPQLNQAPGLTSQTSVADFEATTVVQGIRDGLPLTALGLPGVEAVFQDPPRPPPDPAILRQWQTSPTTEAIATSEVSATSPATVPSVETTTSSSPTTAVASPAPASLVSARREGWRQTVEHTLVQAAEDVKMFQGRLGAVGENPADAMQTAELASAARRLQALRQKLAFMVEDWSEYSGIATEKDEATLAGLVRANDDVLNSLQKHQQLMQEVQHQRDEMHSLLPATAAITGTAGALKQPSSTASVPTSTSFPNSGPPSTAARDNKTVTREHLRDFVAKMIDIVEEQLERFQAILTESGDTTVRVTATEARIRELGVVGRHLKALRMRLASVTEAWSGILSVDPTSVAVEDDATLSSLLLANEWIVSALQRYHQLELGVQHQHHELPATGHAATVPAVGAAGVLQIPPSAVSFSPRRAVSTALLTPTKVSARTVAEVNTVIARQRLRTSVAKILDTVEEQLGRFQELAAEIEGLPAHLSGTEAQILELGFVAQSLGVFHEMLAFTIEDSSGILGKEDGRTLDEMMRANDAIVIALETFQRLLLNGQHQFAEVNTM
ncbi:TOM1-like protein 2 [Sparganum proliferum]